LTASAQASLATLRERRDAAAQDASQHMARVATLEERHRAASAVLQRIESLVKEMFDRQQALQTQHDASLAEKLQRENENEQLAEESIALEAERNALDVREGLLLF
jgi:chromosome segregation ATPase